MIPIEDVIEVLREHSLDSSTITSIAKDLAKAENEIKEAKVSGPKSKSRLVALIRSDDPAVARAAEAGAFIVSVPDGDDDPTTSTCHGEELLNRLRKAAAVHNDAPKGKRGRARVKIETWFQAFSHLKAKTIKESGSQIGIKSKGHPCEVVVLTKETLT